MAYKNGISRQEWNIAHPSTKPNEEIFEVFSRSGDLLGQLPRSQVHAQGQWHKSVQIYLYGTDTFYRLPLNHPDQIMLIAQRAANKDLYANAWDHAVGEHVQPGESFKQAARRGLLEELGITAVRLFPFGTPQWFALDDVPRKIADHEIQQTFVAGYSGSVSFKDGEVAQVEWIDLKTLDECMTATPETFTPWFLAGHPELKLDKD